jgi:hypothetical protein
MRFASFVRVLLALADSASGGLAAELPGLGWAGGAVPAIPCGIADVVASELTVERFRREFENERPVVIRGATNDWPAQSQWSKAYLLQTLQGHEVGVKPSGGVPASKPIVSGDVMYTDMKCDDKRCDSTAIHADQKLFEEYVQGIEAEAAPSYVFSRIGTLQLTFGTPDPTVAGGTEADILKAKYGVHSGRGVFNNEAVGRKFAERYLRLMPYFEHWLPEGQTGIIDAFELYFSLGGNSSGLGHHKHQQAWCSVIAGAKHWQIREDGNHDTECIQGKGDLLVPPPTCLATSPHRIVDCSTCRLDSRMR